MSLELENRDWYQVIIRDPYLLSGESVARLTSALALMVDAKFVYICDVIGAALGLGGKDAQIITREDFDERVADADQYDWAFFYFLNSRTALDSAADHNSPRDLIEHSALTVRLVDSEYIYVYVRDLKCIEYLRRQFPDCQCEKVEIGSLQIPY